MNEIQLNSRHMETNKFIWKRNTKRIHYVEMKEWSVEEFLDEAGRKEKHCH